MSPCLDTWLELFTTLTLYLFVETSMIRSDLWCVFGRFQRWKTVFLRLEHAFVPTAGRRVACAVKNDRTATQTTERTMQDSEYFHRSAVEIIRCFHRKPTCGITKKTTAVNGGKNPHCGRNEEHFDRSETEKPTFFHRSQRWKKPTQRKKPPFVSTAKATCPRIGTRDQRKKNQYFFTAECGEKNLICGHSKELNRPQLNGTRRNVFTVGCGNKKVLCGCFKQDMSPLSTHSAVKLIV